MRQLMKAKQVDDIHAVNDKELMTFQKRIAIQAKSPFNIWSRKLLGKPVARKLLNKQEQTKMLVKTFKKKTKKIKLVCKTIYLN